MAGNSQDMRLLSGRVRQVSLYRVLVLRERANLKDGQGPLDAQGNSEGALNLLSADGCRIFRTLWIDDTIPAHSPAATGRLGLVS